MSAYFDSPLIIYAEENIDELRAEYVRLMAKWRTQYRPEQVCQFIFKNLRSPDRYNVAAYLWANDLEITEQIDNLVNGKTESLDKKEHLISQLQALVDLPSTPSKEKIAAIQLIAQMEGLIIKQVEKKSTNTDDVTTRHFFVEDT